MPFRRIGKAISKYSYYSHQRLVTTILQMKIIIIPPKEVEGQRIEEPQIVINHLIQQETKSTDEDFSILLMRRQ